MILDLEAKLIAGALSALALLSAFAWFVHSERQIGAQACRAEVAAATLKATEKARDREAQWQIDAQAITEVHDEELRRIAAQHVRDLDGLRNRTVRLPEASRPACAGATGAELSGRDASDLVGLAARADSVRADLEACRAWIEEVTPK